ncbi:AfsR/SARP family transcriptional regulator [Nocardioides jejuensis]|uniref:SARP family transcriptional regulator n=1 Tax=Nocardioides jejuensis TaxID=2502782 RepID=A0A4R1CCQ2_9ACTN|nr:BTAD domain-containing putative transcriptional regulator [Nocardioides jejuensis]TCJ28953.1 SARP family transcriptional regulator [Nocardioides jejuensis]
MVVQDVHPALPGTTVHLFDGPFVTITGSRISVPEGSKRLLAFVALRQGRVERRHAAGMLWPTCDDQRAAGNLRSALWRLRGAGIDIVASDKWALELRSGVQVDVIQSLEWASRLIRNLALPTDLTLETGRIDGLDLLPGWYDDWAVIERERVRQRMLHALEALSTALVVVGRYAEAVEVAMTAVNAEPLRESAQRILLEAHAAEGNWVEVRRSHDRYRELARRELGVDPSQSYTAFAYGQQLGHPLRVPGQRPPTSAPYYSRG